MTYFGIYFIVACLIYVALSITIELNRSQDSTFKKEAIISILVAIFWPLELIVLIFALGAFIWATYIPAPEDDDEEDSHHASFA